MSGETIKDMERQNYPIGIQDFEKLRTFNNIYVDKTWYVQRLVEEGVIYFLSRPRRFGKSLLLSTLHAFFEGRRDLFKGLAIEGYKSWDWESYPVIHVDFNGESYDKEHSLESRLNEILNFYEEKYEIVDSTSSLAERFRAVITTAYKSTGKRVVILIDEYDKPILDTLHEDTLKGMHHSTLRAFYASLKGCDKYLRFCFLTGITRFGQLNIFSGLNNLNDISLDDRYAGICGITEPELHDYFQHGVEECAAKWGCTTEEAYTVLKDNYDGYHFSPSLEDVYNPWSVLCAVSKKMIDMYWNKTGGGSSFVYRLLEARKMPLKNLDNARVDIEDLQGTSTDATNTVAVLYQSGYLTIKSYDPKTLTFELKYPNYEVERGFLRGLLPAYSGMDTVSSKSTVDGLVKDLETGDIDGFMEKMQEFFEDFPFENSIGNEKSFQNIMYCISKLIGLQTQMERHSARGSADMVVQTPDYVYVMEFKVDKSPDAALRQIDEKGYALPFRSDARTVLKVGVEFSLEDRNIKRWKIMEA